MIFQHNSYYILILSLCLHLGTPLCTLPGPTLSRPVASLTRNVVWDKFTSWTNSRLQLSPQIDINIFSPYFKIPTPSHLPALFVVPIELAIHFGIRLMFIYFSLTFSWKDAVNKLCYKLPSVLIVIANSFNLYVLCLMNFLLSDVKLTCLFSRYSKLSERSTSEKDVLKHEFRLVFVFLENGQRCE